MIRSASALCAYIHELRYGTLDANAIAAGRRISACSAKRSMGTLTQRAP
jgi:hypothetical protein